MIRFFRKYHKWLGLFFSFFLIMFALSGIILNHRKTFSGLSVTRSVLPQNYRFNNWNNGSVKGAFQLSPDSIIIYGGSGMWLTNNEYSSFDAFTQGLKKGVDNRNTGRIVRTKNGNIYAATTFDLYQLGPNHHWKNLTPKSGINERIADIESLGDTLVVLTRSNLFLKQAGSDHFEQIEIQKPMDYSDKVSLFRTLWLLHSGELFGLPGKLFVDILGVLLIVISITGIMYTFLPGIIRRRKRRNLPVDSAKKTLKTSLAWHNKPGAWLLVFFVILSVSGMFLRPPLLISIIRTSVSPVPGSILKSSNPWRDKLRCIRFDEQLQEWLVYTSSGFYSLSDLSGLPQRIMPAPPVSVMGINVLEPTESGWLVGSFSGLYLWDREGNKAINFITKEPVAQGRPGGRTTVQQPVSGLIMREQNRPVVFDYSQGALVLNDEDGFAPMPDNIKRINMSLWHVSLEVHVGRAYSPIIGPFSNLFIFITGLMLTTLLITGYVVYARRHKRRKNSKRLNVVGFVEVRQD